MKKIPQNVKHLKLLDVNDLKFITEVFPNIKKIIHHNGGECYDTQDKNTHT